MGSQQPGRHKLPGVLVTGDWWAEAWRTGVRLSSLLSSRDAWVAQSGKRRTSAQVMISRFMSWSPLRALC